jgi:hypothetical protein
MGNFLLRKIVHTAAGGVNTSPVSGPSLAGCTKQATASYEIGFLIAEYSWEWAV